MQISHSPLNVGGKLCPGPSQQHLQGWVGALPWYGSIWRAMGWHWQVFILGKSYDSAFHFLKAPGAFRAGFAVLRWVGGVGLFCCFGVFWCSLPSTSLLCKSWSCEHADFLSSSSWGARLAMEPHLELQQGHSWGRGSTALSSLPEWDSEDPILEVGNQGSPPCRA